MNKAETAIRHLLAAALTVFGANKFLHFMPQPDPPPDGGAFLGALAEAGYIFPTVGITFLLAALCLFTKRTAFGLVILFPIVVSIILYHLRYDVPGIGGGAVLLVLQGILIWMHRGALMALLRS